MTLARIKSYGLSGQHSSVFCRSFELKCVCLSV